MMLDLVNNIREHENELTDDDMGKLLDALQILPIAQLLLVYVLWEFADFYTYDGEMNGNNKDDKLVFVFDNIDIVSEDRNKIFNEAMDGFWSFLYNSRNLFVEIQKQYSKQKARDSIKAQHEKKKRLNLVNAGSDSNECIYLKYPELPFLQGYDRCNIVYAMRETTAMHIPDHIRDRFQSLVGWFDMSQAGEKARVIEKRIDLAENLISSGEITNQSFVEYISCIKRITEDRPFTRYLSQYFNDDYRSMMTCLCHIVTTNLHRVQKALSILSLTVPSNAIYFGSRGIFYRLLYNLFREHGYFTTLGVVMSGADYRHHEYTRGRIILTILCNLQNTEDDGELMERRDDDITLLELWKKMEQLMQLDDFINTIDGMYSLRGKTYWNHLITFDNVVSYSRENIKEYLDNATSYDELKKYDDIHVRLTPAGVRFVKYMCVHYEYFACRFSPKSLSLFEFDNLCEYDSTHKVYPQFEQMKRLVDCVYTAVSKCCRDHLAHFNASVMNMTHLNNYDEISGLEFFYNGHFQEERIIHHHISYLESYRECLIKFATTDEIRVKAQAFIVSYIEKYLKLLREDYNDVLNRQRDEYIPENSKALYQELSACIGLLKKSNYRNRDIKITREYYRLRFPKGT